MVYIITFFVSLAAATILPFSSEATLLYYIHHGHNLWALFVVAGLGNILGSVINYAIGLKGITYLLAYKKISKEQLNKSQNIFKRYGAYALLLSWVPIIGDPLTLVAGALKYDFKRFLLFVSIAKLGRYAILIFGYLIFK